MTARFHRAQTGATVDPVDEPFVEKPASEVQKQLLLAEIVGRIAGQIGPEEEASRSAAAAEESTARARAAAQAREPRAFQACVCCAMQQWTEHLHSEFLVGEKCTIKDGARFADHSCSSRRRPGKREAPSHEMPPERGLPTPPRRPPSG